MRRSDSAQPGAEPPHRDTVVTINADAYWSGYCQMTRGASSDHVPSRVPDHASDFRREEKKVGVCFDSAVWEDYMGTKRPTPAPQKQPPPGHDEVSEESLRQIGRCAFGIVYPGDDDRARARCPAGGGCRPARAPVRDRRCEQTVCGFVATFYCSVSYSPSMLSSPQKPSVGAESAPCIIAVPRPTLNLPTNSTVGSAIGGDRRLRPSNG